MYIILYIIHNVILVETELKQTSIETTDQSGILYHHLFELGIHRYFSRTIENWWWDDYLLK